MSEEDDGVLEPSHEIKVIRRRRFEEARDAGLTLVEARLFAESDIDIGLLRKCVEAGCPAILLAKIIV